MTLFSALWFFLTIIVRTCVHFCLYVCHLMTVDTLCLIIYSVMCFQLIFNSEQLVLSLFGDLLVASDTTVIFICLPVNRLPYVFFLIDIRIKTCRDPACCSPHQHQTGWVHKVAHLVYLLKRQSESIYLWTHILMYGGSYLCPNLCKILHCRKIYYWL